MKKKNILWSTHNWVILYTVVFMFLILLYCLPNILIRILPMEFLPILVIYLGPDATSAIPLEIFSWGLVAIVAGYSGIDRAGLAVKTSLMEIGTCDMGNPAQTRVSIYLLCLVFVEILILNFCLSTNFIVEGVEFSGLQIPMTGVSSALVSTVVVYVLGNKSIRLTQNIDKTKETEDWADEKKPKTYVAEIVDGKEEEVIT